MGVNGGQCSLLEKWKNPFQVGFYSELIPDNYNKVNLLVEKDFKCLDNTIEDQPNFNFGKKRK